MKNLLPVILLAVFFAVFGFLITVYIPAKIISLGFDVLNGGKLKIFSLIILVVLAVSRGLFRYGEHYFGHYVAFKVLADFRREIFAKLRRLVPSKLDSQDSGTLLKLIGEDVTEMAADERARRGIFMSFQSPIEVPGISVENFIRTSKSAVDGKPVSVLRFNMDLSKKMRDLQMKAEYAGRYMNYGFSGGEKKKTEILQMQVLNPKLAMLDETDSG